MYARMRFDMARDAEPTTVQRLLRCVNQREDNDQRRRDS